MPKRRSLSWLLRLASRPVAELLLGHLLTLINLLGVFAFGLLVDEVPRLFDDGLDLLAVSAERFLRSVEDAHRVATSHGKQTNFFLLQAPRYAQRAATDNGTRATLWT